MSGPRRVFGTRSYEEDKFKDLRYLEDSIAYRTKTDQIINLHSQTVTLHHKQAQDSSVPSSNNQPCSQPTFKPHLHHSPTSCHPIQTHHQYLIKLSTHLSSVKFSARHATNPPNSSSPLLNHIPSLIPPCFGPNSTLAFPPLSYYYFKTMFKTPRSSAADPSTSLPAAYNGLSGLSN